MQDKLTGITLRVDKGQRSALRRTAQDRDKATEVLALILFASTIGARRNGNGSDFARFPLPLLHYGDRCADNPGSIRVDARMRLYRTYRQQTQTKKGSQRVP